MERAPAPIPQPVAPPAIWKIDVEEEANV